MTTTVRRVVTGHDRAGKAVVVTDGEAANVRVRPGSGIGATLLWVTDETPADLSRGGDAADRQIGVSPPKSGSIFRIVEFPPEKGEASSFSNEEMRRDMGLAVEPGAAPPRHPGMHRTASIDYAIVMSGEIDMLLDDSEVHLKAGDVVVQQATSHAWANRGNAPCQIAFVLIGANAPWE